MAFSLVDLLARTAWHEAGHATIARVLGLGVRRASASADDPHVMTRRVGVASTQFAETVKKLLLVDLAGPLAERRAAGRSDDLACRADEQNALSRALWLVRDEHGLDDDEELGSDHRAEAEALVAALRPRAAALVEEHWAQIWRVAAALAAGAVLHQASIDALMAAAGNEPR
jgi:hypothetical protein